MAAPALAEEAVMAEAVTGNAAEAVEAAKAAKAAGAAGVVRAV